MMQPIIIESSQRRRRLDPNQSRPQSLDVVGDSNRPVLEWILHALQAVDAERPIYVGGYHIEKVIESFPGLNVRYHQRRDSEGELGALCCCERPGGAVLLLSAATVLLPGALERLACSSATLGVYGGGSFAGVCFLGPDRASEAFDLARELLQRDPMAGLDALFSRLQNAKEVNLDGVAAPIVDQQAVARTIFRGKAQTLDNLTPLIRGAAFLPRERIEVTSWQNGREAEIDRITKAFVGQIVVVRSSTSSEDGLAESAAGKFRTILNVAGGERIAVGNAIDAVVASYAADGRLLDAEDEILIQPQLRNLKASGVLLTRDPRSGAPYFVINEDRLSGRSDVVTAGSAGILNQQFVAWSGKDAKVLSPETRRLLDVGSELIHLSHLSALDVEYAIDNNDTCHLLQIRPLAAARQKSKSNIADDDVLDLVAGARAFVAERMRPVAALLGTGTVLGVMPDWNPAEMIGASPRPLALSLYQKLIGENAWADARRRVGYRDLRPEPLIVVLGGRPYVDVRASLNSFLPATLDEKVGSRWVDACLDRLRADPALHDKIEFEIALSCLAPDWETASSRLVQAGIVPEDFAKHLRPLTSNVLRGVVEPIGDQLKSLELLAERRQRHLADDDLKIHGLSRRILCLLSDCQSLGLVPFSILARYAFISMSFLRGLLQSGVITSTEYEDFLRAIPTVAGGVAEDLGSDLPIAEVVARYGHLRPNSYEITSPNYASNPEQFLKAPAKHFATHSEKSAEDVLRPRFAVIERALSKLGLDMSAERLVAFIVGSIGARERAKFEFMKSLNAALEDIAALGRRVGFDREILSYLPIDEILRLATDSVAQGDRAYLRRRSAFNEKRLAATRAIRLPDVIRHPDDVLAFRLEAWRANFVTRKRIEARAVWLDETGARPDIAGAIVVTRAADPGYDWIFAHGIAGLVTEYGGIASHMSIRAAEFGLPAAIGCGAALIDALRGATMIELDCAAERVRPVA